jgi:XTP/dITP diphosphohydrolase
MNRSSQKYRLLVATNNRGKAREIKQLLTETTVEIIALPDLATIWQAELGLNQAETERRYQQLEEAMCETADTFVGNATIKATGACRLTGFYTLADDSGLVVDYLKGDPGVLSARYAGRHGDDQANNELLLANLAGVPFEQRTARFEAALVFATPSGQIYTTVGACEGSIALQAEGNDGFGYDPIFVPLGNQLTMAQITLSEKNLISHRAKAIQAMQPFFQTVFK